MIIIYIYKNLSTDQICLKPQSHEVTGCVEACTLGVCSLVKVLTVRCNPTSQAQSSPDSRIRANGFRKKFDISRIFVAVRSSRWLERSGARYGGRYCHHEGANRAGRWYVALQGPEKLDKAHHRGVLLCDARADAHGALLWRDAGVAAEHATEVAEIGEAAAGGGFGDAGALP